MKIQFLPPLVASLVALALVPSAGAQVYKPTSNKAMSAFIGAYDYDYVYDTTTDSAGNRYVCGYLSAGGTNYGYVSKITKKGFLGWTAYSYDFPNCIAADNFGHVYVGVPTSTPSFAVRQMDASTGATNYTTPESYHGGYIDDIAVMPDGSAVTASDSVFGESVGTILFWPDSTTQGEGWYAVGKYGHINKMLVGPDGAVYTAGWAYHDDSETNIDAQMMYIGPGGGPELIPVPLYNLGDGNNYYFTDLAIDPVSNVVVAVGGDYPMGGGFSSSIPFLGAFYADYSSGSLVANMNPYYLGDYSAGSICQGVAADPIDGSFAIAVSTGIGGTPSVGLTSAGEAGGSSLFFNYESFVPATDTGTYNYAYDIAMDGNGPLLAVISDLTIGLGSGTYQGVQVFSYDHDGNAIDRKIYGQHAIAPVYAGGSPYYDFPRDAMTANGGYLSIFGNDTDGHSALRTAQLLKGPDDVYKTDEDTPLHVGLSKSVLNNDGNQFLFDPLTAQIQGSSVSAGIHSVTLNPDGTFDVTLEPNFNGLAKFKYRVKQNGVFIKTNQVKINVKPKNDAPTAVNDSFNVAMNSAVQNLNVLGNDSDIDGDNITIFSKTNNANATIGITPDKKFITFKPKAGFSGDLTFTYTIRDTAGLQSTATVSVHVS